MHQDLVGSWRVKYSRKLEVRTTLSALSRSRLKPVSVRFRLTEQRIRNDRIDTCGMILGPKDIGGTWIASAEIIEEIGTCNFVVREDELSFVPHIVDRRAWEEQLEGIPLPWTYTIPEEERTIRHMQAATVLGRTARVMNSEALGNIVFLKVPRSQSQKNDGGNGDQ